MEYSGWAEQAETVFIHLIVGCDEIDVLVRNFQSSVVQSIKKKKTPGKYLQPCQTTMNEATKVSENIFFFSS